MPWETIQFWHWLALGALLMIAEIFAPGVLFLWLGIAAALTGLIVLIFSDLQWGIQLILFGCLAVLSVVAGRMIVKRPSKPTSHPSLNRRPGPSSHPCRFPAAGFSRTALGMPSRRPVFRRS